MPLREIKQIRSDRHSGLAIVRFCINRFLGKNDLGGLVKGPMDMKVNQATTCLRESYGEIKLDPQICVVSFGRSVKG